MNLASRYPAAVTNSMSSRALPFAVLIFAGIFFWAWVVLAGAGGGLTDPADILTQGAQATAQADSFHLSLTVEGDVTDRTSGDPVALDGVSVEGDVDVANHAAQVSFSLPMLFGMEGELILIDGELYLLTPMSGDQWIHLPASSEGGEGGGQPSEEPTSEEIAQKVDELLATEGVSIAKLADQACGNDTCYHVQLSISEEAMAAHQDMGGVDEVGGSDELGGLLPDPEFSGPAVVDLLFQHDGLWLREVTVSSEGDAGEASFNAELSGYNTAFDIAAPPADQVIEGDDIPFFQ
jgi:hypothetical protein